jgi:hypothetical protein
VRLARYIWTVGAALAFASRGALATDWDLSLDTRLVFSNGDTSFLDDGQGALRYGADRTGIQVGRARFALGQTFGDILALRLDASHWSEHDKNPIDLTEAYLELRPYPWRGLRARVKAGAFFLPLSLENTESGWDSPYTLSSSAIDSWVAEELRTIGLETRIDWLGTRMGHDFNLGLFGAAFGWNEPAGAELAFHGFAIDDQQTTLFGRVGKPGPLPGEGFTEFHEFDGRVGEYVGGEAQYLDRLTVVGLHYDNHADPAAYDPTVNEHSWATSFDSVAARARFDGGWTLIVQYLDGVTAVTLHGDELEWYFRARFALASKQIGKHTFSVRYDEFTVEGDQPFPLGNQSGHATTLAYVYRPNERWRVTLEGVRVRSGQTNRALFFGATPFDTEDEIQLAARYSIGSR